MTNPFNGLSKREEKIKLEEGKYIKVRPMTKDAEMFLNMKTGDAEANKRITNIMKDMIRRAYTKEELSDEDLESGVAKYYGVLFKEIAIIFKFATREQLEKAENDVGKDFPKSLRS